MISSIHKEAGKKEAGKTLANYFTAEDFSQWELTLEGLFKAGVHYGHKKSRRNPMMEEYVYTYRGDLALIDLKKTKDRFEEALAFMASIIRDKKTILFVGTKKHAHLLVRSAAERCESPYITDRWLGGTFTNFDMIRRRVRHMEELEEKIAAGEFNHYTKFEQMKKAEEAEKLEKRVGGLRKMKDLPGAVFIADIKNDAIALCEAVKMHIPVIAFVDTNDDPTSVDYLIPANNDAISSLKYLLGHVCRVYMEEMAQMTVK